MKNFLLFSILIAGLIFSVACSSSQPAPNTRTQANNAPAANLQDNTSPATGDANIYPLKESVSNSIPVNGQVNKTTPKSQGASRPAPDDSRIITELTDVPTETRIFNSHPVLQKVIKTGLPPNQRIKIHVKGGKIIELPGDKIPNMIAPAETIMREAGLTLPESTPNPRAETKKPEQKP
jgi:hypothetical protein